MDMNQSDRFFLCPCNLYKNLKKYYGRIGCFFLLAIVCFVLDQSIKSNILEGYRHEGEIISIIFVLNKGVAFSMFSFIGEYLKWIQLGLLLIFLYIFLVNDKLLKEYFFPFSLIIGSGFSNLYDRFEYGGVVDCIFWHYQFEFAVFNLADIFINIGVGILILMMIFRKK